MGNDISPEIVVDGSIGCEMKLQAMKLAHLTGNRDRRRHRVDWTVRFLLGEPRHDEHIQLERMVYEELAETHKKFLRG